MPRLIWTPLALRDLTRLHAFLDSKSPAAAHRAAAAILEGVLLLQDHPGIGRPVDDMNAELREWPISFASSGYVVLYRHDGDAVVILTVRHGREFRT